MRSPDIRLQFGLAILCALMSCKSREKGPPTPSASAGLRAAPAVSSALAAPSAPLTVAPMTSPQLPEGPVLAIDAGKGVGPIRIGANVSTIERLMGVPCEVKTADLCRFITRAVEFDLKNGVTDRIVVHRHDRPAGPDASGRPQSYGFFNGGIPPGVGLGMIPSAVVDLLGKPTSRETVTEANAFNTVERDTYPGMVLEYDTYTNGKVILGGVLIAKK